MTDAGAPPPPGGQPPPPPGSQPPPGWQGPPDRKGAKAHAKASKAYAKASRPWFKKKRFVLGGLLALILVIIIVSVSAGGGGSDGDTAGSGDTKKQEPSSGGVSKGAGSSDASADVEVLSCENEEVLNSGEPVVKVTNNSSKRSDYFITVAVETDGGKTQVDTALASVSGLEPGQSTEEKAVMVEMIPDGATCRAIEVQRTAAA